MKFGQSEDDEHFMDKEYSVFRSLYTSQEKKVEIEDTEESVKMQQDALEHLHRLLRFVLSTGIFLWGSLFAFTALALAYPMCYSIRYLVLGALTLALVHQIHLVTQMLSNTTFEGRPLVRFIALLDGFDNYRVTAAVAILDFGARFTRAMFIVFVLHTSTQINDRFVASVGNSRLPFLAPFVKYFELSGLCIISFVGSFVVQGTLMLYSLRKIQLALRIARLRPEGESLSINHVLADYGVVANWAMLNPAAKIFSLAAVPVVLEDRNDAHRLWDQMRTGAIRTLVHVVPDTIISLYLQSALLGLSVNSMSWMMKATRAGAILCSWASAMATAYSLLKMKHVLTVTVGLTIMCMATYPCIATVKVLLESMPVD
jgi:hypothetical protein